MSIFGNIMSSIFGHAKAQPAQPPAAARARLLVRYHRARAIRHPVSLLPAGAALRQRPRRPQRRLKSMSQPFSPTSPAKTRRNSIGEIRLSI